MGVVASTHKQVGRGAHLYTWVLGDDDSGAAVSCPQAADKSVQMVGTWDSATITMQGSNETVPVTWQTLEQVVDFATDVSASADSIIMQVGNNSLWVRPLESGGAGSVAVTVYMLVRNG